MGSQEFSISKIKRGFLLYVNVTLDPGSPTDGSRPLTDYAPSRNTPPLLDVPHVTPYYPSGSDISYEEGHEW